VCIDKDYARELVLVASENGLNVWEIWFQSGLLAKLIVKVAIANFGVALFKCADPFSSCNGIYETPPNVNQKAQSPEAIAHLKKARIDMSDALKTIAFKEALFWGMITNFSLSSLIFVALSDFDGWEILDFVLFGVIMTCSVFIPLLFYGITIKVNRLVDTRAKDNQNEDLHGIRVH